MKSNFLQNPLLFCLISILVFNHKLALGETSLAEISSQHTTVAVKSCKTQIETNDPNGKRYRLCPGVLGYKLKVHQVEAGRVSIDILTPTQKIIPLNILDYITRSMSSVRHKVEWRVLTHKGKLTPIALILHVDEHANLDEPQNVSNTYVAIVKITPQETCITDRLLIKNQSELELRSKADTASTRKCLTTLPRS